MNQDNFICEGRYTELDGPGFFAPFFGRACADKKRLFGIFDGMGGEECGEVASYIAAVCASKIKLGRDTEAEALRFCKEANAAICEYASKHSVACMGTTAAAIITEKDKAVVFNVGDSRIFRFDGDTLAQISVDHVAVSSFKRKPPLLQFLGIPETEMIIEPHIATHELLCGDRYLICSDGLTDMVEEKDIAQIIKDTPTEKAAEALLERALQNGGRDNITVILLSVVKKEGFFKKIFGKKPKNTGKGE